jgi:hypothetical protein
MKCQRMPNDSGLLVGRRELGEIGSLGDQSIPTMTLSALTMA